MRNFLQTRLLIINHVFPQTWVGGTILRDSATIPVMDPRIIVTVDTTTTSYGGGTLGKVWAGGHLNIKGCFYPPKDNVVVHSQLKCT